MLRLRYQPKRFQQHAAIRRRSYLDYFEAVSSLGNVVMRERVVLGLWSPSKLHRFVGRRSCAQAARKALPERRQKDGVVMGIDSSRHQFFLTKKLRQAGFRS